MAKARNLPLKEPQCRHKEEFVTYTPTFAGLWFATCSNCTSVGGAQPNKEEARYDLMRIEAAPVVQP